MFPITIFAGLEQYQYQAALKKLSQKPNKFMENELSKNQVKELDEQNMERIKNALAQNTANKGYQSDAAAEKASSSFLPPSIGRIVHYFPSNDKSIFHPLPNGMEFAPAIITQIFIGTPTRCNLCAFVDARPDQGYHYPVINIGSVTHASERIESEGIHSGFWVWPNIVR